MKAIGRERGSMTLEAAVMMPAFAAVMAVFVFLIRLVMTESALQSVAAESVKQLSGALVPFEEQLKEAGRLYGELDPDNWAFIPEPAKPFLAGMGAWRELTGEALQTALSEGLKPVVWSNVPESWKGRLIHKERLRLEEVAIPHLNDPDNRFGFVLVYEVPVPIPFMNRIIEIRKGCYERVWFGA